MSHPPTESGECSREVEALFELGRRAYMPTPAERARVRSALVRRLGEASLTAGMSTGASGATASEVVALGIGLACLVVVGALTLMRIMEPKPPSASAPVIAQTRSPAEPSSTTQAERVRVIEPSVAVAATPAEPEPARAARSQGTAPSNARTPRTRSAAQKAQRAAAAKSPPPPPARAQDTAESVAAAAPDAESEPPVAAPPSVAAPVSPPESQPTAAETAAAQPRPQPSPTEAVRHEGRDQADARAELGIIARMHTALQEARPQAVLALCAEHARRWPHGTFVQEREGLRAVAACSSRAEAASALARAFLASYPRGPLAARVRDACGL